MKKNKYVNIILLPIIFVLISIGLVTAHNIYTLKSSGTEQIEKFTNEYMLKEKTAIYNRVHYVANSIKMRSKVLEDEIANSIKTRVDRASHMMQEVYNTYKDVLPEYQIKEILKTALQNGKFESANGYYAIIDLNTKKMIVNKNKDFINKDIANYKDINGEDLYSAVAKNTEGFFRHIYFPKPQTVGGKFKKLIYIKKFEPFNWVISTGEYDDEIQKKVQASILKSLNSFELESNPYLFIIKLKNLAGGENFGKVILHQMRPELIGKTLDENVNDERMANYRTDYLNVIQKSGEGFVTYYFNRPNSDDISKKMSYFYLKKDWNWVIGTGFYFDDLESNVSEIRSKIQIQTKENVTTAVLIAVLLTLMISMIFYIIYSRITNTITEYSDNLSQVNNELERRKNILQTLFEKTKDGIILFDESGLIIDCNDSIIEMLKYDLKEDILGQSFADISPKLQPDGQESFIKGHMLAEECFEKKSTNFEWLHLTKDKNELWCDVATTKLELDHQVVIHSVVRDITDKKILEEKSKKQNLLLAEESKKSAMGEMIANIAHQWRQPLNNISLLIHFVRDNFDNKNFSKEELRSTVKDIKVQIEYMSKTIDDFTNFINPRKEITTFTLKDMLQKAYQIVHAQFDKKDIIVIHDIDDVAMQGVENELVQVVLNVLNNARDSFENVQTKKLIFIDAKETEGKVTLTIKDNAGGIPADVLPRIFEPYFTTKHKSNGTGIGLYMSEDIIHNQLNGQMTATNVSYMYEEEVYEGAMFTIIFKV